MLEQTKRKSFRISSVLSKVEPDLHTGSGSDQKVPAPTGSGSTTQLASDVSLNQLCTVPIYSQVTSLSQLCTGTYLLASDVSLSQLCIYLLASDIA